jgi:NADPH:quinone reductase and related Zn-dependent oxidoreductases
MKAIIVQEAGGVENFKFTTIEKPAIKENEVLIKVSAISINPVDYKVRATEDMISWLFGNIRPVILGWDISGTVVESKSPLFHVGQEVFGMHNFPGSGNGYAEYVAVNATHFALKPANISHEEAAAATLAPLTAWQALYARAGVKKGDKVLINGASGGVGHYATQIANQLGAEVTGISSGRNKEFVLAHGAHHHIDYTDPAQFENLRDFDVVFDTVGNKTILEMAAPLTKGGTIVTIVHYDLSEDKIDFLKAKGIQVSSLLVESSGIDMTKIASLLEEGTLKSHVSQTFDFEDMGIAHKQLETGRTVGKLVVRVK